MAWTPKGNIKGPAGIAGPPGAQGPAGPTGSTGSQGPPGAQGTPGEKWSSGAGPPVGTAPGTSVGDWYLDTTTGDIWEKTTTSGWTLRGNIKGSKGDPGPTGSQGPQGNVGATGPPGSTGPAGPTGAQGPKGDPGATGATGGQGPQGVKGDTGSTGAQGPQGAAGLGVPAGGVAGAILRKKSATDNDTEWKPLAAVQGVGTGNPTVTGVSVRQFGVGALITPTGSGKVLAILNTQLQTSGGYVAQCQIRYGPGTAPANGALASGTAIGNIYQTVAGQASDGVSFAAIITGLTVGQQYWFDFGAGATNAAAVTTSILPVFSLVELP
jgi:hypothetical protein